MAVAAHTLGAQFVGHEEDEVHWVARWIGWLGGWVTGAVVVTRRIQLTRW